MKLREYKRVLFFLKILETFLETETKLPPKLISFYTDSELREMAHWLYRDVWSNKTIGLMERSKLVELINAQYGVLLWSIDQLDRRMTSKPSSSQEEVDAFFQRTNNEMHYLASKPVGYWDKYDASNYRNLLVKTGTTKKAYAIFTSDVLSEDVLSEDVLSEDVYAVTTKPSHCFDTKEEAETEITNIVAEGKFTNDDLVVHSLWLLT
jgi:hypothetical protein